MARIDPATAGGINVLAFLDMIAWSEIGPALLAASDDGYNVLVGSTADKPLLFSDYTHHPRILNRELNSTAAGRDQIIFPTWAPIRDRLHLPDFSPPSQDLAAIDLLREHGALPHIMAGNPGNAIEVMNAIDLGKGVWASFAGAGARLPNGQPQHEQRMSDLLSAYYRARARYATMG